MDDVIKIILKELGSGSCSQDKAVWVELLIKANAIQQLQAHVDSGMGFAIEALGKIAASSSISDSSLPDAIEKVAKSIEYAIEKRNKDDE